MYNTESAKPVPGNEPSFFKKLLFSDLMLGKTRAKKIAYVGVIAALCIVSNLFELKFATTQYSLTIFTSVIAGVVLGPALGFGAVFLGDGVGYFVNSMGYPYYWWVALSCALMAVIGGLAMRLKLNLFLRMAIVSLATFFICSVLVNSLGMYYIGLGLYMPKDVKEIAESTFGGTLTFGIYLAIRFFLLGQIWNSLVNYALLFAVTPALAAMRPLGLSQRG